MNWLTMDPKSPKCCVINIAISRKAPFTKNGDRWTCPDCGREWVRSGDEIRASVVATENKEGM